MNCSICGKHMLLSKSNTLYESSSWVISPAQYNSQILGYVYLEPKRHVEEWTELSEYELSELGNLIRRVEAALKKVLPVERLYTLTISEVVRHLHVHLIPRLKGMEVKGTTLIERATLGNVNKKEYEPDKLDDILSKIKVNLK